MTCYRHLCAIKCFYYLLPGYPRCIRIWIVLTSIIHSFFSFALMSFRMFGLFHQCIVCGCFSVSFYHIFLHLNASAVFFTLLVYIFTLNIFLYFASLFSIVCIISLNLICFPFLSFELYFPPISYRLSFSFLPFLFFSSFFLLFS